MNEFFATGLPITELLQKIHSTSVLLSPMIRCATCSTVPIIDQTPLTRAMITE